MKIPIFIIGKLEIILFELWKNMKLIVINGISWFWGFGNMGN